MLQVPAGVTRADLPVAGAVDGRSVELRTDREVEALYELTRWALEYQVPVTGLTVSRHSLEDVYLQLTGADPDRIETDSTVEREVERARRIDPPAAFGA